MSRPFRLEGTNIAILQEIEKAPAQFLTPKQLAEKIYTTKDKQPLVFKHLHSLEKHGYLRLIQKSGYTEITLTAKANALLGKWAGNQQQDSPIQKRAHALAHYYPLKDPISQADLRLCLQQSEIAYSEDALHQLHFTYEVNAELFSTYLMLFAPALYQEEQENSKELEAKVKRILDDVARKLEAQLNRFHTFKLMRIDRDTLISYYTKEEIAHEAHALAEALPADISKITLAHSPIDGRERLNADSSLLKEQGFKELEPVHKVTAGEDSNKIYDELHNVEASDKDWNDLLDGKIKLRDINHMKALLSQQLALNQGIIERQAEQSRLGLESTKREEVYTKNIEAHALAIAKLNLVLDSLIAEKQAKPQAPKPRFWDKIKNIFNFH